MRLLFVYNADSGPLNTLLDIAHKAVSPATYRCDLCSLTHGLFHESARWRAFRQRSPIELMFLHRDEFERRYHQRFAYPVVLKEEGAQLTPMLESHALARMKDTEALIQAIESLPVEPTADG